MFFSPEQLSKMVHITAITVEKLNFIDPLKFVFVTSESACDLKNINKEGCSTLHCLNWFIYTEPKFTGDE